MRLHGLHIAAILGLLTAGCPSEDDGYRVEPPGDDDSEESDDNWWGTVLDQNAEPVEGLLVRLDEDSDTTGADGSYALTGPRLGPVQIDVYETASAVESAVLCDRPADHNLYISGNSGPSQAVTITVEVTGAQDETGLGGVVVYEWGDDSWARSSLWSSDFTEGDDGEFAAEAWLTEGGWATALVWELEGGQLARLGRVDLDLIEGGDTVAVTLEPVQLGELDVDLDLGDGVTEVEIDQSLPIRDDAVVSVPLYEGPPTGAVTTLPRFTDAGADTASVSFELSEVWGCSQARSSTGGVELPEDGTLELPIPLEPLGFGPVGGQWGARPSIELTDGAPFLEDLVFMWLYVSAWDDGVSWNLDQDASCEVPGSFVYPDQLPALGVGGSIYAGMYMVNAGWFTSCSNVGEVQPL